MELLDTDNYDQAKREHQGWADKFPGNSNGRDDKWTRSIAFGSKEFVDKIQSKLGILAQGRDATETDEGYQLREPAESYLPLFEADKGDIEPGNTYFLNITQ